MYVGFLLLFIVRFNLKTMAISELGFILICQGLLFPRRCRDQDGYEC